MKSKSKKNKKAFMLFEEPTPYVLGLIRELRLCSEFQIDALFIQLNKSQTWDLDCFDTLSILPSGFGFVAFIFRVFFFRKYNLLYLSGWGAWQCRLFLLLGGVFFIPVTVESDTQINKTPIWKRVIKKLFYPFMFSIPKAFFPAGTRQHAYFRNYCVRPSKLYKSHMTVNVEGIRKKSSTFSDADRAEWRLKNNIKSDDVVFLFVGRLLPCKNLIFLFEVFSKLSSLNIKLVVVGDGELRDEVVKYSNDYENIIYMGKKYGIELWRSYYSSDVCVLPSNREQWGLVVIEALAFGKPVLVSHDVGCADDLVIDKGTGYVLNSSDCEAWLSKITDLAENQSLRKSISKRCFELASKWTLCSQAMTIDKVWREL